MTVGPATHQTGLTWLGSCLLIVSNSTHMRAPAPHSQLTTKKTWIVLRKIAFICDVERYVCRIMVTCCRLVASSMCQYFMTICGGRHCVAFVGGYFDFQLALSHRIQTRKSADTRTYAFFSTKYPHRFFKVFDAPQHFSNILLRSTF